MSPAPIRSVAAALLLVLLLASLALARDLPPLAWDDVFLLETASDPQPAPGGDRIVFVRNWMDRQTDRVRTSLWIVDADGGNLEPLTPRDRDARAPRWSPDGRRIAYLADGQIHVHWLASGRDTRISELPNPPADLAWSPDGQWLVFTMLEPASRSAPLTLPGRPEGAEWAPEPIFIDSPVYRADGRGYLPAGHRHIFKLPAEGGSAIRLTEGDWDHGEPA